ncbi:unnamed protein product [Pleuronectes platessa]|uniref:Uncharacterized protein n=1 Tax=Pleuronectes platessa TaxID=8262 RepID=A0A9N7UC97_PLEPL|nr:unnamed protein product [Pleuronectes platessa]
MLKLSGAKLSRSFDTAYLPSSLASYKTKYSSASSCEAGLDADLQIVQPIIRGNRPVSARASITDTLKTPDCISAEAMMMNIPPRSIPFRQRPPHPVTQTFAQAQRRCQFELRPGDVRNILHSLANQSTYLTTPSRFLTQAILASQGEPLLNWSAGVVASGAEACIQTVSGANNKHPRARKSLHIIRYLETEKGLAIVGSERITRADSNSPAECPVPYKLNPRKQCYDVEFQALNATTSCGAEALLTRRGCPILGGIAHGNMVFFRPAGVCGNGATRLGVGTISQLHGRHATSLYRPRKRHLPANRWPLFFRELPTHGCHSACAGYHPDAGASLSPARHSDGRSISATTILRLHLPVRDGSRRENESSFHTLAKNLYNGARVLLQRPVFLNITACSKLFKQ